MKRYILNIEQDMQNNTDKIIAKIGGMPTYMPDDADNIIDYYVMEIYNSKIIDGNEDILCWQIYQDSEFGGVITEVIEIKKGAKPYVEGSVPLRRWIKEYNVSYEEGEKEYKSMIKGNPGEDIMEECASLGINYLGIIYEDLCPYCDLSFGTEHYVLGLENGTLVVE